MKKKLTFRREFYLFHILQTKTIIENGSK